MSRKTYNTSVSQEKDKLKQVTKNWEKTRDSLYKTVLV